jgi:hypothetical protein
MPQMMISVLQQVRAEGHERLKMEQIQGVDDRASMRKALDELERKTKRHLGLGLPAERFPSLEEIAEFLPRPHLLLEASHKRGAVIDAETKNHQWLLQVSQRKSESYWDFRIRDTA